MANKYSKAIPGRARNPIPSEPTTPIVPPDELARRRKDEEAARARERGRAPRSQPGPASDHEPTVTPVVLVPRFTTFLTQGTSYTTLPIDVSAFSSAMLTAWRSQFLGSVTGFQYEYQGSMDRDEWTGISGPLYMPNSEQTTPIDLTVHWLRVEMSLLGGGDGAGVTCWIEGFLLNRED